MARQDWSTRGLLLVLVRALSASIKCCGLPTPPPSANSSSVSMGGYKAQWCIAHGRTVSSKVWHWVLTTDQAPAYIPSGDAHNFTKFISIKGEQCFFSTSMFPSWKPNTAPSIQAQQLLVQQLLQQQLLMQAQPQPFYFAGQHQLPLGGMQLETATEQEPAAQAPRKRRNTSADGVRTVTGKRGGKGGARGRGARG